MATAILSVTRPTVLSLTTVNCAASRATTANFLNFYYDVFAHITQAETGDGRLLKYDYDDHGDLVTVTLPDISQINYTYQHTTVITNSTTNVVFDSFDCHRGEARWPRAVQLL